MHGIQGMKRRFLFLSWTTSTLLAAGCTTVESQNNVSMYKNAELDLVAGGIKQSRSQWCGGCGAL